MCVFLKENTNFHLYIISDILAEKLVEFINFPFFVKHFLGVLLKIDNKITR